MINGVQDIYYNVSDMKRAVKFYQEVLGMKVLMESDHWTNLDAWGVKVGLHASDEIAQVPRDSHGAHGGGTLTLRSDNAADDHKMLQKQGVKILGSADVPWGNMVVFEDPDGNVLKLMEPKY